MAIGQVRFILNGWIVDQYITPDLHFHYFGFSWVPMPSEFLLYALFGVTVISALCVALGFFYRIAILLFFFSFTYIELLDATYYLNHYYFISLVAFVMIFLPAHHALSLDVRLRHISAYTRVKKINILAPRLLVGGLYFMAGIAKLNPDWLLEALPMRIWLPPHSGLPIIGSLLDEVWVAYLFSWGGALFDLSVPFLLAQKRTRSFAFAAVVIFHSMTFLLFPIGMFPFVMILCAMVFFEAPEWERTFKFSLPGSDKTISTLTDRFLKPALLIGLFFVFVFPFRYLLYPRGLFLHEQGYRFSWRVMLMEKTGTCFFYVRQAGEPGSIEVDNRLYLTKSQEKQMSTQPDLILQFAHFLEQQFEKKGIIDPAVYVQSWVSVNGSGSRLFIDPEIDLTQVSDSWQNKSWVIPADKVITPKQFY